MAPRPSSTHDITRLVRDLSSDDLLRRESAIARLAITGDPAIGPVAALAARPTASPAAKIAALQTLAATGTPRVIDVARTLLGDKDDGVAAEAIDAISECLRRPEPVATIAFERLAEFIVSGAGPHGRRLAALAALGDLPTSLLKPLRDALAGDVSPLVQKVGKRMGGVAESLDDLMARGLPDDPGQVEAAVKDLNDHARVGTIKRAIDAVREQERRTGTSRQTAWRAIRGALHQHLSARGRRIGLYDLRETLAATTEPLPVGFLAAAATVGDETCLEPLAQAWVAARPHDRWWRDHLAEAFGAIVKREGITRRHQMLRRILQRWPSAGVLVASARRP